MYSTVSTTILYGALFLVLKQATSSSSIRTIYTQY